MAKVVVTGASGFIGAHLVRDLLAANHEVTCLVRSPAKLPTAIAERITVVRGDIRDRESVRKAVQDADQVFHLAGLVKARRLSELLEVNQGGTRNLALECVERANPPALVFVSSLAATGPCRASSPLTELDPAAPVSNYGRSKLAAERELQAIADRLPATIVRPAIVFGPGDRNSHAIFAPIARFGLHALPGRAARPVSVIHVADLCRLLMLAAERGARLARGSESERSGEGIYFATSAEQITYTQFGEMIGAALGRRRVWKIPQPRWAGFALAGLSELTARCVGLMPILNVDKMREAFAGAWHCSGERVERELGFRTTVPLAERIAETVAWYQAQGSLPRTRRMPTPSSQSIATQEANPAG